MALTFIYIAIRLMPLTFIFDSSTELSGSVLVWMPAPLIFLPADLTIMSDLFFFETMETSNAFSQQAPTKTLEKYRLAVRGFYVKNEWLMNSH